MTGGLDVGPNTDIATVVTAADAQMTAQAISGIIQLPYAPLSAPAIMSSQMLLASSRHIRGHGIGRTVLQIAAGTGNQLTSDGWIRNRDWTNGNNDILLEDFEINGNRTNRPRTSSTDDNNVFFQGSTTSLVCNRIGMNRVYTHSSNGQGAHYRYVNNSWMDHVQSNDNGRNNTDLTWNGIYWLRCVNGSLNACRADSQNDRSGIKTSDCQNLTLNQCIALNNPLDGFEGGDPSGDIFPDGNFFYSCIAGSNGTATNGGNGFDYNLTSGSSKRVWFINPTAYLNANNGILVNGITGGGILFPNVYNNSKLNAGWQGIRITGTTRFQVKGGASYDDQGTPTQAYAMQVAGSNDYIFVEGLDMRGNVAVPPFFQNAGDNVHGWYRNCPNWNPIGLLASPYDNTNNRIGYGISGGSSTLTSAKVYTCVASPLDLYLAGGTVSAMTKNASAIPYNSTLTLVHLEPTDTWSLTFTVTPTTNLVFGL